MSEKKSYYAIIPATVRYDKRLSPNAKLLYGEISALCNERGYCWSKNEYFADLYEVSKTSISKWISSLVEFGHIKSVITYQEGTKQILDRYLSLVVHPIQQNFNTPIEEKLHTPIEENLKDNNTVLNTTQSNTTVNTTKEKAVNLFEQFVFNLNLTLGKKYKGLDEKAKRQFAARIKQKYTLQDFQTAVQNASYDPYHMETGYKYLTPEFFTRAEKLEKFMQDPVIISTAQKTNHDRLQDVTQEVLNHLNQIPDEAYSQYADQFATESE